MEPRAIAIASELLGSPVISHTTASGGYTHAFRAVAQTSDGRSAFIKAATDDATASWLRLEHQRYTELSGTGFMPQCVGWRDGPRPVLVLADYSHGHWPPPWRPGDVELVLAALEELGRVDASEAVPSLEAFPGLFESWEVVAADPAPFLSLGVVEPVWLDRYLDVLVEAAASVPFGGDAVVHLDIRSDNLVFVDGRALLIDWNWARRGNPLIDKAFWLPSLHAEGGPAPDVLMPDAPGYAALVSGFFAAKAGMPVAPPRTAAIRDIQIAQLMTSLPWACRALGLEEPRCER